MSDFPSPYDPSAKAVRVRNYSPYVPYSPSISSLDKQLDQVLKILEKQNREIGSLKEELKEIRKKIKD